MVDSVYHLHCYFPGWMVCPQAAASLEEPNAETEAQKRGRYLNCSLSEVSDPDYRMELNHHQEDPTQDEDELIMNLLLKDLPMILVT